ncbi:putative fungistatic metabolite [Pseudolycoriella hygida]|uniref:Fungistatic metabolite n=1 Tax=Pseudolycoriella hygida TaxID=35572 RepID=A0A9Q0RVG6_9DIPT|nr:putative fungistatic metabolite [Pseudolycoriella hygida]
MKVVIFHLAIVVFVCNITAMPPSIEKCLSNSHNGEMSGNEFTLHINGAVYANETIVTVRISAVTPGTNGRLGCYTSIPTEMNGMSWFFSANSPATCVAACKQAGYKYAGTEMGNKCFCGNSIPSEKISDNRCNVKCNGKGADQTTCGGQLALEVFDTATVADDPVGIGCYEDDAKRQLNLYNETLPANSPLVCVAVCKQAGFKYAGLEFSNECYCGNVLPLVPISHERCKMRCNGDGATNLTCGGGWALEIFETHSTSLTFPNMIEG